MFTALQENTDGAQDTFLTELVRIMEKYPWCAGVDIDLERGGDYSTHTKSTALFRNIWNTVKAYDSTKKVNICLPGMNSVNGSVGSHHREEVMNRIKELPDFIAGQETDIKDV